MGEIHDDVIALTYPGLSGLPPRVRGPLASAGLVTAQKIHEAGPLKVRALNGVGSWSLRCVHDFLLDKGLSWAECEVAQTSDLATLISQRDGLQAAVNELIAERDDLKQRLLNAYKLMSIPALEAGQVYPTRYSDAQPIPVHVLPRECICPVGSEFNCNSSGCPRRGHTTSHATTRADEQ